MTGAMKRGFDLAASLLGVLLLGPLLSAVALCIRVCDGSPVFFRQVRVGRGGTPFRIWKFRTMVPGAESRGALLTVGGDGRITPTGMRLRRWKIDELPQLFNVLDGSMSLVGPRPEVARYVARYSPEQRRVLDMVPGITDPASIRYRDESKLLARAGNPEEYYIRVLLPEKIRLNLEYGKIATISRDIRVILKTLIPRLPLRNF